AQDRRDRDAARQGPGEVGLELDADGRAAGRVRGGRDAEGAVIEAESGRAAARVVGRDVDVPGGGGRRVEIVREKWFRTGRGRHVATGRRSTPPAGPAGTVSAPGRARRPPPPAAPPPPARRRTRPGPAPPPPRPAGPAPRRPHPAPSVPTAAAPPRPACPPAP